MDDARRMMVVACAALLGCSHGGMNDDRGPISFGPAETGDEIETSGDGDGADESGEMPDDGGESSGGPEGESSGGDVPVGRCDAIDILFVVEAPQHPPNGTPDQPGCFWDETWSEWYEIGNTYGTHYEKLVDGFDTLVSELYVTLQVADFQVLVTGSMIPDPTFWNGLLDGQVCGSAVVELDACDQTLGAGRNGYRLTPEWDPEGVYPGECMPERYVPAGSMDLPTTFSCIARDDYYYWYDDYRSGSYAGAGPDALMDAMTAAVAPTGEASSCNAGFLRDDAVLVVVILEVGGDGLADTSTGTAEAWKDALVAAKGGAEDRIVVLTLAPDGGDPHPLCAPESASTFATDLRTFTESFTHGLWSSSCLLEYPTFFRAGAELIDAACGSAPGGAAG